MIEYSVVCDDCSEIIDSSNKSARQARHQAEWQQGARVALPGGKDLCPACVEQREIDAARAVMALPSRY